MQAIPDGSRRTTRIKETWGAISRRADGLLDRASQLNAGRLLLITAIAATVIYGQYKFYKIPLRGDYANWDYMAQVVSRGGVPYRDVVNIKSPLSAYISAAAIVVARPFGIRDIYAIRIAYILLGALVVALTMLVAHAYWGSRRVALMAAAIMLAYDSYVEACSRGTQPKTPMILFGLATLLLVQMDRPFCAGVCGMLSALSWQPGLLFIGAAGLAFSHYLTRWRDMKVIRLVAGASMPLAVIAVYFWFEGALRDSYQWAVHFNYSIYGPQEFRSFAGSIDRMVRLLRNAYRDDRIYFALSLIGLIITAWRFLRPVGLKRLIDDAPRHAILVAPLVYFAFCLINLQAAPDFIPLLPFVAMFSAAAIVFALDQVSNYFLRRSSDDRRVKVDRRSYAVVLGLILFISVFDAFWMPRGRERLVDQLASAEQLAAELEPGDKIFAHGAVEALVLNGLTNSSRYIILDRGKDFYLDQVEEGGFQGWVERLKAEQPKVVLLGRAEAVKRREALKSWVKSSYEERSISYFIYYVRKQ